MSIANPAVFEADQPGTRSQAECFAAAERTLPGAGLGGYSLPEDVLHFEQGLPDDAIPDRAEKLNAEVAIIGNNEDSNFIDKYLGDTATELTKAMPCDVLVLKADPT